jgi:hypothetical protein
VDVSKINFLVKNMCTSPDAYDTGSTNKVFGRANDRAILKKKEFTFAE